MELDTKEKIKLTVREILLSFCDGIAKFEEIVGYEWQRREIQKYWDWREIDKSNFYHSLWQLEKQGYIKRLKKDKNILELTIVGKNKAFEYIFKEHRIIKPKKWDKKWRMVIFDIPHKKRHLRDIVRSKLKEWNFYQLQKSVFIYPFDCTNEIYALKFVYRLKPYLQYLIVENLETELDLASYFFEKGILTEESD